MNDKKQDKEFFKTLNRARGKSKYAINDIIEAVKDIPDNHYLGKIEVEQLIKAAFSDGLAERAVLAGEEERYRAMLMNEIKSLMSKVDKLVTTVELLNK